VYCLFCDILCIVCVYVCTELLPPGGYPIAVKYIMFVYMCVLNYCHRVATQLQLNISYHIISYHKESISGKTRWKKKIRKTKI